MIIRLERYESYKDASGRNIEYVAERHTIQADVKDVSGDRTSGSQTLVRNVKSFKFRWFDLDVKGRWKIVYRGKRMTVQGMERDRKAYWEVEAYG